MQMSYILVLQVLSMFILAGIGAAMFRAGKITLEGNRTIGNILIYLSLPAVIIKGFMVERTSEHSWALLVSIVAGTALVALGAAISRKIFRKEAVAAFSATFSNPSFFGIPLVTAILGEGAVFYMTGFIAAMNIGQWTIGVSWLKGKPAKLDPASLIRAPFVIAALMGLALYFTQAALPSPIESSLGFVAALNTPLAMFSIGVYLAQADIWKIVQERRTWQVVAVRLILVPAVALLALSILPASLGDARLALLVAQACPVGSMAAVYAQIYERDYVFATECIVASVLASIVSIPAIVAAAQLLWGVL